MSRLRENLGPVAATAARHALAAKLSRPAEPERRVAVASLFPLTKALPDRIDMPGVLLDLSEVARATRYDVALEQYNKTINIEAQLMVLMANRYILPAGYRYQGQLATTVAAVKAAGASAKETRRSLDEVGRLTDALKTRVDALQDLLEHESADSPEKHGKYFRDKVVPAMVALRETGDSLECIVPHDLWPLPTYREMLFVR